MAFAIRSYNKLKKFPVIRGRHGISYTFDAHSGNLLMSGPGHEIQVVFISKN
jgi:hypothetical protein